MYLGVKDKAIDNGQSSGCLPPQLRRLEGTRLICRRWCLKSTAHGIPACKADNERLCGQPGDMVTKKRGRLRANTVGSSSMSTAVALRRDHSVGVAIFADGSPQSKELRIHWPTRFPKVTFLRRERVYAKRSASAFSFE